MKGNSKVSILKVMGGAIGECYILLGSTNFRKVLNGAGYSITMKPGSSTYDSGNQSSTGHKTSLCAPYG